jgi:trehalose 6-phosphate synthase/phosphatase
VSRLVLLSHRPPIVIDRTAHGPRVVRAIGDVGLAIDRAVAARGATWIALAAQPQDELPGGDVRVAIRGVRVRDARTFQAGFGNQVLWPLCHVFPGQCSFHPALWTAYRRANEAFAEATRAILAPDDAVWVNDFHLALVPGLLRAAGVEARVGFFWHIPFPPPAVFGICPWRTDILGGLVGADVLGFQTAADVGAFLDCVERFLGVPVARNPPVVRLPGRDVRVLALPLGVDVERLREQVADPAVAAQAEELRSTLRAPVVVLGVDRLDYAKGIAERLVGYERFLEREPEWRRRVTFVQVTVPSQFHVPGYRDIKRAIEESVGRIVGRFTYEGRAPLAYLYTVFDPERLAAYYLAADVALVTPLRDGMNLIAKEYVACHAERDGVLVLSEFAGAAVDLDDALLVNPYDPEAIRRQLRAAVEMAPAEKRRRMAALGARVASRSVGWWAAEFLAQIL